LSIIRPCHAKHPDTAATADTCRFCRMDRKYPELRAKWNPKMLACPHLGEPTGEMLPCNSCGGTVRLKLFDCAVFGQCTIQTRLEGVACCASRKGVPCPGRAVMPAPPE